MVERLVATTQAGSLAIRHRRGRKRQGRPILPGRHLPRRPAPLYRAHAGCPSRFAVADDARSRPVLTTGMGISRSPQLVSVGYEGREVDDLVSHLLRESVDVLVDVRLTPISRKPGLSKRRLTEALASVGVSYVHFRAW